MTNEGAMLEPQVAPEHRAGFWVDLELAFDETESMRSASPLATDSHGAPVEAQTAELPVAPSSLPPEHIDELAARRNGRRIWPMAAAAALLAIVGIGFLATRSPADPSLTTDLVSGTPESSETVPLDGPADGGQEDATGASETGASESSDADGADAGNPASGAAVDPTPAAAPLLAFELAAGSTGEPAFFPTDGGLPSGAEFLANRMEYGLTWWSVVDGDCADEGSSEIRYVNGSGLTQEVGDPNPTFRGPVSHFTATTGRAAWVVACGSHLELWASFTLPSGHLEDPKLVWFGPGQAQHVSLRWVDQEINLGTLGVDGLPFSIEFEAVDEIVTRNGRPTRFELESGARDHRTFPVAVSRDGDISYWPGVSDQGQGACAGSFGRAGTLWLRRLNAEAVPVWELALAETDRLLGAVTAMAVEPELSQVAFADVCPDEVGRVFIATQRADGQLSNVREIDLGPYVPGFADALHWIDPQTLRIETDNSQFGVDPVRFDFRFDDGREDGVIVQLD